MGSAGGDADRVHSGVEVDGRAVRALVLAAGRLSESDAERATALLSKRGIDHPRPGAWYPLADYLAVVTDLRGALEGGTLRSLGYQLREVVAIPTERSTVPAAMAALDDRYHASHRGGDVGGYDFRQIGDADGRMECQTPYPCDLDHGLVEGVASAVADGCVRLNEVGACGGDRCTYEINW